MKQVQVAVVGASGYTGQELLRILLNHRGVKLVCATSRQYAGQPLWEVFPRFRQVPGSGLKFTDSDVEAIAATGARSLFWPCLMAWLLPMPAAWWTGACA